MFSPFVSFLGGILHAAKESSSWSLVSRHARLFWTVELYYIPYCKVEKYFHLITGAAFFYEEKKCHVVDGLTVWVLLIGSINNVIFPTRVTASTCENFSSFKLSNKIFSFIANIMLFVNSACWMQKSMVGNREYTKLLFANGDCRQSPAERFGTGMLQFTTLTERQKCLSVGI